MFRIEWQTDKQRLKSYALVLLGFVALIWFIEIVDWLTPWASMDGWGIRPRTLMGLTGIVLAPFLHGNFAHVAANSLPFLLFGGLIMLRRPSHFWAATLFIVSLGGIGTWLTGGANSVHIGASGLVFGYFGFLLLLGYFERSVAAILQSLLIGFFYGGLIWGVLPGQVGISWQGHLFGFLAGALAAYLLSERDA
jgi:membrane associated rhomboid family serine protease